MMNLLKTRQRSAAMAVRAFPSCFGLSIFVAVLLLSAPFRADADVAPPAEICDGNVCTGSLDVGDQVVNYAYTQHINPDGTFRIRLNGGEYNTGTLISHIVYGLPAFGSWSVAANPAGVPSPIFLPEEDINPTQTAYERYDSDGCFGCVVDQVLSVTYSGLAEGVYLFDIAVFQNGEGGSRSNRALYVHSTAPSNTDESESWDQILDMDEPCADGVDNDLNFLADCSDTAVCSGQIGQVVSGIRCEASEISCSDMFDNDGDGMTDCQDPDCDGRVGDGIGGALCQFENEWGPTSCTDGFDNDGDGFIDCIDNVSVNPSGVPARTCWKQSGYGCPNSEIGLCGDGQDNDADSNYDSAWDDNDLTGGDCMDYDCAGDSNCPSQEHLDALGNEADMQCFNMKDDDLDGLFNCADPDCLGMDNGSLVCYEKEFDLTEKYQMCANVFDDDGDTDTDCADSDCGGKFGNCGPCPDREDVVYDSCSDGRDEDSDGTVDCADSDCYFASPGPDASLGYLVDAARCAKMEGGDVDLCTDMFDNDADGDVDCADGDCSGTAGCAASENTGMMCGDVSDNDGDGLRDCVDPDCWGLGLCAPKSWASSACQIVPRMGPFKPIASVDPTITAAVREAAHVNSQDVIRLVGAGNYSSVTIVIGDNTNPADYYPYAQPKTSVTPCTLTGTNSDKLDFTAVPGRVVQIFNRFGMAVDGFDLTFTCDTTSVPLPLSDYPISVSAEKLPGNVTEYGDEWFDYILYEATLPIVVDIEGEGESPMGNIDVRWGESRRFRIIADDTFAGLLSGLNTSGICACTVNVDGVDYDTPDSDCVTEPVKFTDDRSVSVAAFAEDGANNIGPATVQNFDINVIPALRVPLSAWPADGGVVKTTPPFFRAFKQVLRLDDAVFETDDATGFPVFSDQCEVFIRNKDGVPMGGGPGPIFTYLGAAAMGTLECGFRDIDLSTLPGWAGASGEYFVTIRAVDNDGDWVESNRRVIYICHSVPSAPNFSESDVCSWADFDRDGAAEGLFTNLYWSAYQSCDNCVNLYNPLQSDSNANGLGDNNPAGQGCEPGMCGGPGTPTGRCEVNREYICGNDTFGAVCPDPGNPNCCSDPSDPMCCPSAAGSAQECRCPWGMCLYGGQVCFEDAECGFCLDDPSIGCITDGDCQLAIGDPAAVCDAGLGWGRCAGDGTTLCKRDADCAGAFPTPVAGPCMGANICDNLMFPWLETTYGNIFSGKKIYATQEPPAMKWNATYCITAKSSILSFTSELCTQEPNDLAEYERPKPDNAYSSVLGRVDVNGILSGKYGKVIEVSSAGLDNALSVNQALLDGQVFVVTDGGDAIIGAHAFSNAMMDRKGKVTILIKGGDLYMNGNITYVPGTVTKLSHLASVGWMVLPADDGTKGHVFIDQNVRELAGAFFIGGQEGMYTVAPPVVSSENPLTVYGLAIARKFHLNRSLRNVDVGSERFIYDGRAVVNPPPGFEDIGKSLPVITDMP